MFVIKQATTADIPLINKLAWNVFPETYKNILSHEQIEYMMDWMYSIENLHKQMEEEGHIYYIAYEECEAAGYVSIRQEDTDLFHLEKIYVIPYYQKYHLGKQLFQQAIKGIKEIHPAPCRMELNVNRNNKALRFYEYMGMKKVDEGDFAIGNGYYMNDYICKSCYLNQHVVVIAIENNQSSQKEIINLIELFIKNLLEENAYGV